MIDAIAALRAFNRFFTRHAGVLDAHFLGSDLNLVEARVLYEIATRDGVLASAIAADLGVDAGFLSRIVARFVGRGLIERGQGDDGRRRPIRLTAEGAAKFAAVDARQVERVADALAHLGTAGAAQLVAALATVRALLTPQAESVTIREFRHGDMAAIVAAQAGYYAAAEGWSVGMEALVLEVTAKFLRSHVAGRSNCWVAERGGAPVGSVFCFDAGGAAAQLRLMYADPAVRGQGVGRRLVEACVAFARAAGYRELMLWTHTVLVPARALYASVGFELVSSEVHEEFGEPVHGETWVLKLA